MRVYKCKDAGYDDLWIADTFHGKFAAVSFYQALAHVWASYQQIAGE